MNVPNINRVFSSLYRGIIPGREPFIIPNPLNLGLDDFTASFRWELGYGSLVLLSSSTGGVSNPIFEVSINQNKSEVNCFIRIQDQEIIWRNPIEESSCTFILVFKGNNIKVFTEEGALINRDIRRDYILIDSSLYTKGNTGTVLNVAKVVKEAKEDSYYLNNYKDLVSIYNYPLTQENIVLDLCPNGIQSNFWEIVHIS